MKVKTKLTVVILLFSLVPFIIISIIAFSYFEGLNTDIQVANIDRTIKNQAENVELIFNDIITSSKEISSIAEIKKYATLSNKSDFNVNDEENFESSQEINNILNLTNKTCGYVINTKVINNNGVIIASDNEFEVGKLMEGYIGLDEIALKNNGITGLMEKDINGVKTPYFVIVKNIYSFDNQKQGLLYQQYNLMNIQQLFTNIKIDKYTSLMIFDKDGNVLHHPYNSLKNYQDYNELNSLSGEIEVILKNAGENAENGDYITYKFNRESKYFNYSYINNCGLVVVGLTRTENIISEFNKNISNIRLASLIMGFVVSVLVIVFVFKFTSPFDTIIQILNKKQKGDMNAKLSIDSKDEFGYISNALNTLFNEVMENEQRYRTIVEMTNNIVFEINFRRNYVFISKNFNKQFSFRPKNDTLEESFFYKARVHKDDRDRFNHDFERIIQTSNFMQGEYRIKNIYGEFSWVQVKANKFYDRNEIPTKIVGVIADIDREKKSEMHLVQRACYDNLTQLFNRETFIKNLGTAMEQSAEKKTLDALLFIDLDDFKFFNDQYTHACGDEVLKFVADTLKEICFEKGFAGRMGGDEFVACIKNLTLIGDIGKIAQEIIDILGQGFVSEVNGKTLTIHCSIGIAFFRENGRTPEQLIASADEAMYIIKKHGKSAYTYAKSTAKQA